MSQNDGGGLGCLFSLGLVAAGLSFSNFGWTNAIWYSMKYGVEHSDVITETKPSDCDFMRAPMGFKECSYKARVRVYNADGVIVGGETGKLRSISEVPAERQALQNFMSGAIGLFKNPRSHRSTDVDDPTEAASMLIIASYAMQYIDDVKVFT